MPRLRDQLSGTCEDTDPSVLQGSCLRVEDRPFKAPFNSKSKVLGRNDWEIMAKEGVG